MGKKAHESMPNKAAKVRAKIAVYFTQLEQLRIEIKIAVGAYRFCSFVEPAPRGTNHIIFKQNKTTRRQYMYNNMRYYSLFSATLMAIILAFSVIANAHATSASLGQLSMSSANQPNTDSGTKILQPDKNDNGEKGNNGKGNKQASNQTSGNDDDDKKGKNGSNDNGNGKQNENNNKGHGKKIKIKAQHDEGGKVKVEEEHEDDSEEQGSSAQAKAITSSTNDEQSESFPTDFQLQADDGIALERGQGKNAAASSREDASLNLNASMVRLEGNHVRVDVDGTITVGETKYKISDGNGIIIFFNNPGKNFFRGIIHITGMALDSHDNKLKFHMRAFLIPSDDGDESTWNFVVAPAAKLGPKIRIVSLVGELSQIGADTGNGGGSANQHLDHFAVSTIPTTVEVGKLFNVTVTAKDKDDKTLKNYVGNARVSDKSGTVKPILLVGFKDGVFSGKMNITKATTSDKLTFTDVTTKKNGTSNTFNVVAGPISKIQLDPSSVTVQPGHKANFTATLLDRFENKISPSGKAFTWLLSSPDFGSIATNLNKANFTASSSVTVEANVTLTVKVNVTSSAFVQDHSKITISPTPQQALDHFIVEHISGHKMAGVAFPLNLTAVGSTGQPVTSYHGTIVLNDTTGTLQVVTNNGFSDGLWSGTVKITKASDNVTITVRDHDSPTKIGSSNQFEVRAAAIDRFKLTGIAGNQTAGKEFSFDVTALDEFGNTVKDYNGTVTLSTNDGSSPAGNGTELSPSPYTFIPSTDKGKHAFNATLYNAKANVTISVTESGKEGTSNKFTVQPSDVAKIIISPVSVSLAPGENANFTANAKDSFGNEVEPSEAVFTWSLSSLSLGLLDPTTGSVVKFTATTEAVGSISVTSGSIVAYSNITVTPS
jgi:hypothetical protein